MLKKAGIGLAGLALAAGLATAASAHAWDSNRHDRRDYHARSGGYCGMSHSGWGDCGMSHSGYSWDDPGMSRSGYSWDDPAWQTSSGHDSANHFRTSE